MRDHIAQQMWEQYAAQRAWHMLYIRLPFLYLQPTI
jgi:hypothetical protein